MSCDYKVNDGILKSLINQSHVLRPRYKAKWYNSRAIKFLGIITPWRSCVQLIRAFGLDWMNSSVTISGGVLRIILSRTIVLAMRLAITEVDQTGQS